MAEQTTDQIIKEHFETLPEPVKKAIASFDWAREVFDIGRKHSMHIDRIGELQTEVMLVVLGLISPRDFQNELMSRIEPNREIALEVSDEVNKRVFIRIRDFMKDFYEREGAYVSPEKEDELRNSEKSVLRTAGIKVGDEANEPEPAIPTVPFPLSVENDEIVSLVSESELEHAVPPAKADTVIAEVTSAMSKPEVYKSPITVMTPKTVPKNFLDPYREPVE